MKNHDRKASQAAPASQEEKTCSRRLGESMPSERAKSYTYSHRTLVAPELLAIALLTVFVLGYIQSRPNTAGVDLEGSFDCERAFADVRRLVAFGPRPSGSEALGRIREFIVAELRTAGATVVRDTFTASTPLGPIPMSNIVAKIPGDSSTVVIIAGHYDTKRTNFPFVEANDGGSSAAFLLEMARVLARRRNSLSYCRVLRRRRSPGQLRLNPCETALFHRVP